MSNLLSPEHLIEIHNSVIENSDAEPGILNIGLLSSISVAPDESFQGQEMHPSIPEKAAVLMERIIRLHPFVDGNKRTSLFAMVEFLQKNDYTVLLPLDAVRKTVLIAERSKQDPKSNEKVVKDLARWIKNYSLAKNASNLKALKLMFRWMIKPFLLVAILKLGMGRTARKRVEFWFAFDIHPEYRGTETKIMSAISESARRNLNDIEHRIINLTRGK